MQNSHSTSRILAMSGSRGSLHGSMTEDTLSVGYSDGGVGATGGDGGPLAPRPARLGSKKKKVSKVKVGYGRGDASDEGTGGLSLSKDVKESSSSSAMLGGSGAVVKEEV